MGTERWQEGTAYERFMGRWSRRIAREFVEWLARPPGERWLDLGCGTGALSDTVEELAAPGFLVAVDRSVAYLRNQARSGSPGRRRAAADALWLPFAAGTADVSVSGLALNFVASPVDALLELKRVTRPGGVVAAYVWDYAEGMEALRHFWDAARELDPDARVLDEGERFPVCRPEGLRGAFEEAGYGEIEVASIETRTEFRDFTEYWEPFLGGQGPAPGHVASMSGSGRAALRDGLRDRVPVLEDGSISLRARAWAAKGTP